MYTSILIEVTIGSKVEKFEYELDNEICPEIIIPNTWKSDCVDPESVLHLIDNAFDDGDMEEGLKATILDFDQCVPPDFQSGKRYEKFMRAVKKAVKQIENLRAIEFKVLNTEDESTVYEKKLIF